MKNNDNTPQNREVLNKVKRITEESGENLPESLSEESIVALVSGKKQKNPVSRTVRRFVSIAVAACIVICSLVVLDSAVYAPQITVPENKVAHANSYSDISKMMQEYFKSENFRGIYNGFTDFFRYGISDMMTDKESAPMDSGVAVSDNASSAPNAQASASETSRHSDTNLREAGIYEADIVKTDGKYIYALYGENFYTVNAKDLKLVSQICLTTPEERNENKNTWKYYNEFYLLGDTLVVETSGYRPESEKQFDVSFSGADIYDISNRSNPQRVKTLAFEGRGVSSRIVEGKLVLASSYFVYPDSFTAEDYRTFVPAVYNGAEKTYPQAESIVIADTKEPDNFLTVAKIDLQNLSAEPKVLTVFGAGCDIYCTAKTLYVYSGAAYGYTDIDFNLRWGGGDGKVTTSIMSFDITAETPTFLAKGCVEGWISNTWALDEYNGYLRVTATSDGTRVYVLDSSLNTVGTSEVLAKGEQLKAVRFMGNTAYIVTFFQTDPLFVLDLSDPKNPQVTGELKIPGFSTYLHPVGENLLLGIGEGGTETGTDGSAKLSLFDVSDPKNPLEISTYTVPMAWFDYSYKSFVTVGDGTYIIPMTRYKTGFSNDRYNYKYIYEEEWGAVRIAVKDGKIQLLAEYFSEKTNVSWVRALFIDSTVYNVLPRWTGDASASQLNVIAYDMETGNELLRNTYESISFPETTEEPEPSTSAANPLTEGLID